MAGVVHEAVVSDGSVWVTAEVGAVLPRRLQTVINGRPTWFDSAHTGTEHVVAIVDDVDAIDAVMVGRLVRHHADLASMGTNVNFVQSAGQQALKIRTYERGVEAETLSCGSGATRRWTCSTAGHWSTVWHCSHPASSPSRVGVPTPRTRAAPATSTNSAR
ncbi:hypothetical protein ACFT4A_30200 [Streptomyces sp. NPDC057099]|uniref:hypothetical protein n=1 Tax=Streptomyces sp. NPDC057099 TaxID=3346019 RepID=UPI00363543FE